MEYLARYLDEIVEPTIKEFEAHPISVRHAFLASVAVFHSIDYLTYPKKSRGHRQRFRNENSDFALIDDVAHAFKHVSTHPHSDAGLKAHEVISRPPAYWGVAVWGLSRWGDAEGGVTLKGSHEVDLLAAMKRATAFLRQQITKDK